MLPWLDPPGRKRELERISRYYPSASFHLPFAPGESPRLNVIIAPTPYPEERRAVATDLELGIAVGVGEHGRLHHSPLECAEGTDTHAQLRQNAHVLNRPFAIRLEYPLHHGDVVPVHPRAKIIYPKLPRQTLAAHPHMHFFTDTDEYWACPLPPHQTDWSWHNGGTMDYLDQLSIWLLKTDWWLATGGGVGRLGTWLGPDATHDARRVLFESDPASPCRCGRGDRYRECHFGADLSASRR